MKTWTQLRPLTLTAALLASLTLTAPASAQEPTVPTVGRAVLRDARGEYLLEDGRTGFLVTPQDVAAYADAIERLVRDDALRARMGAAAHVRAQDFRWDAANEAVLTAYREVLAARAR